MENKKEVEEIESGIGFIDFSQYQEDVAQEKEVETATEFEVPNKEEEVEEKEKTPTSEEPKEEEEVVEEVHKKEPVINNLSGLARKYVESGFWDDFVIETEDGEVTLSEIEDLDEDKFLEIQRAQQEEKDKKQEGNIISRDSLDEYTQQIFDVAKEGGNVTKLLEIKRSIIDPLEGYDLDNEQHQEALVRSMYAVENGIKDPHKIDKLIAAHKEELDLDTTARDFSDRLKNYYKSASDQEKQIAQQRKLEEKQKEDKLKEDLTNSFKEFGVKNDNSVKPLIEKAFKKYKEGGYEISKEFEELKNDPKEFAEYLMWKYNRDDYNKMISSTEAKNITRKNLTRLSFVRNTQGGKNKEHTHKAKNKANDFMSAGFEIGT